MPSGGLISGAVTAYVPPYTGAATTTVAAKLAEAVSVKDFGAKGDGSADDTAAIQQALTVVAAGTVLLIPLGSTFRTTAMLTRTGDIWLDGGGKLLFDFAGTGLQLNGSTTVLNVDRITFDGNAKCNIAIDANGIAAVYVGRGVVIQNVDSTTGARGLQLGAVPRFSIRGATVKSVKALANGTQGDFNGTCIGIYATGQIDKGLIEDCVFDDVNNRTSGGAFAWEDADAISCQGIGNEKQVVSVLNCRFNNCGKRAAKFNSGNTGCKYEFIGNEVVSTITGTVDDGTTLGNGMWSCVSAFGGVVHVARNRVGKPSTPTGVISYFLEGNGTSIVSVYIEDNYYAPEAHAQANTVFTKFCDLTGLTSFAQVHEVGNTIQNILSGTRSNGPYYFGSRNKVACTQNGLELLSPVSVRVTDCEYTYDTAAGSSSSSSGIILYDGLVSAAIRGNTFHFHAGNVSGTSGAVVVKAQTGPPVLVAFGPNGFDQVSGLKYSGVAASAWLSIADGNSLAATTTAASFTPDGGTGASVFDFTANAAATINAPTNLVPGRTYDFILRQDGVGGRTWTWNAAYAFPVPWSDLNNTAGKVYVQKFRALTTTTAIATDKLMPPRKSASKAAGFTLAALDNAALDEYAGTFSVTIPAASVLGDCFRYSGIWVSGTITLDGPGASNGSVTSGRFDVFTANANVYCTIYTSTSATTTKLS